jgi:arylsulfatase A-like enzyme
VQALAVALVLLPAACGRAEAPGPAGRPPNVLLVVIDTLRADHLSPSGYGRDTSPRLAAFAQGALRFTHAQTPRAKTSPAVASLMTGLYPHEHGVRDLTTPLAPDVPLLAEAFSAAGYATCGIVGNFVLQDARSGLARGFDTWVEDLPDTTGVPPDHVPQRTARSLTDGALVALGRAAPGRGAAAVAAGAAGSAGAAAPAGPHAPVADGERPWFLYLHYMDPHGSYAPPAEHDVFAPDAVDPSALVGASLPEDGNPPHPLRVADYNIPEDCRRPDGSVDAACVRARYDGEIRYADAEIGRLLDALALSGALERTLVVITSDHGESLGEHNEWFEHGYSAYEDTCRVPLLIAGPGLPGGVTATDVSLTDLAPTIAELAGLDDFRAAPRMTDDGADTSPDGASDNASVSRSDEAQSVRGTSLAALVRAPPARPAPRAVFCEKIERADLDGTVQQKAVRLGDWKAIRRYGHVASDGGRELRILGEELYDLARDPGETVNLAASPPPEAPLVRLQAELFRFAAAEVRFEDLAERLREQSERLRVEDPEAYRVLEQMGYVGRVEER